MVEVDDISEQIIRKKSQVSDYWQNDVKQYRAMRGETKSVKYETEVFDPVISDKTTMVCICNKCALRYTDQPTEKGGVE